MLLLKNGRIGSFKIFCALLRASSISDINLKLVKIVYKVEGYNGSKRSCG